MPTISSTPLTMPIPSEPHPPYERQTGKSCFYAPLDNEYTELEEVTYRDNERSSSSRDSYRESDVWVDVNSLDAFKGADALQAFRGQASPRQFSKPAHGDQSNYARTWEPAPVNSSTYHTANFGESDYSHAHQPQREVPTNIYGLASASKAGHVSPSGVSIVEVPRTGRPLPATPKPNAVAAGRSDDNIYEEVTPQTQREREKPVAQGRQLYPSPLASQLELAVKSRRVLER